MPLGSEHSDGAPWLIHTIWSGALSVGGTLLAFLAKRTLDGKADVSSVDQLRARFDAFMESINRERDVNEQRHQSNTARLDKIIFELTRGGRGSGP